MRSIDQLSLEEAQILQFVNDSDSTNTHKLNIINQVKQYSTYGGKTFDMKAIQKLLDGLTTEGFLRYLQNLDSYSMTAAGKESLLT